MTLLPRGPGLVYDTNDCPVRQARVPIQDDHAVVHSAKQIIAGMPGFRKVVQVKDTAVAVVADTWWQAKKALDALPIVWDEGANASKSSATIAEMLKDGLNASTTNGDRKKHRLTITQMSIHALHQRS